MASEPVPGGGRSGPPPPRRKHPLSDDERAELGLIERSRSREAGARREDATVLGTAAAFVLGAVALLLLAPPSPTRGALAFAAVGLVAFALASTVEFEIGSASSVPTVPVLIPLLAVVPPALVPPLVAVSLLLGARLIRRQTGRREAPLVTLTSAFHSIGPAAVVAAVGWRSGGSGWLLLAAAVAAQLAGDLLVSWVRNCVGLGLSVGELLSMLRWTYVVDLTLAPVGFLAAAQLGSNPAVFVVALTPVGLLAILAADRRRQIDRLLRLDDAIDAAHRDARRDPLTGLGNRLAWDEALADASGRHAEPVAVILLDVDRLKQVNDRYGHHAGDRLIRSVADAIRSEVPPTWPACRVGGDEFGLVLHGDAAGAHREVVSRLHGAVGRQPPIGDVAVSVSIGSSTARGHRVHESVALADDELYSIKRQRSDRASASPTVLAGGTT